MSWISEEDAAKLLQRNRRTLRRLVTSGKWKISFTSLNGRTYRYAEADVNRKLKEFAVIYK